MSIKTNTIKVGVVSDLFSIQPADGDRVETLGYSDVGDGGSNLYFYDVDGSGTIDGGFTLPGVGGSLSFSGGDFNGDTGEGRFVSVDQTVANVLQFGAPTDGTDAQPAIQRVIDAAASQATQSGTPLGNGAAPKIRFPRGVYVISSPIVLPANAGSNDAKFTIVGDGRDASIIKVDSTLDGASVPVVFDFEEDAGDSNSHWSLRHIGFEGPDAATYTTDSVDCIDASKSSYFRIEDCWFRYFDTVIKFRNWSNQIVGNRITLSNTGCLVTSDSGIGGPSVTINDNIIERNSFGSCGIGVDVAQATNFLKVRNNQFDGSAQKAGIVVRTAVEHLVIEDNYFESAGLGGSVDFGDSDTAVGAIVMHPQNGTSTASGTIRNNYFINCNTTHTLSLSCVRHLTIVDNQVNGSLVSTFCEFEDVKGVPAGPLPYTVSSRILVQGTRRSAGDNTLRVTQLVGINNSDALDGTAGIVVRDLTDGVAGEWVVDTLDGFSGTGSVEAAYNNEDGTPEYKLSSDFSQTRTFTYDYKSPLSGGLIRFHGHATGDGTDPGGVYFIVTTSEGTYNANTIFTSTAANWGTNRRCSVQLPVADNGSPESFTVRIAKTASTTSDYIRVKDFSIVSANVDLDAVRQKKSSGVINILDYGAVGDGSTDDTSAIQAAIDAGIVVQGVVFFPPGEYLVSSTCQIGPATNGLKILGYGATIKMADGVAVDSGGIPLYINQADDVTVEGLTIDGNAQNRTWASAWCHGVMIVNSRDITLRDVNSINGMQDGYAIHYGTVGDESTYCRRIKLLNCTGTAAYRNNVSVIAGKDVEIIGGTYSDALGTSPEAGIDVEADAGGVAPVNENILIQGVTLKNNNGNNGQISGVGDANDIRIIGCRFQVDQPDSLAFSADTANDRLDISGHPFVVGSAVNFQGTMPSPLAEDEGYYVVDIDTDWIQVSATRGGSVINLTTAGSGTVFRGGGRLTCNSPSTISENRFKDIYVARGAIDIGADTNAGETIISNNRFENISPNRNSNSASCIYVHSTSIGSVSVTGNHAKNIATFLVANSDNISATGNVVDSPTLNFGGLAQFNGVNNFTLTGNTCTGANKNAVFVLATSAGIISGNSIIDTIITDNSYGTIRIHSNPADVVVSNNLLTLTTPNTSARSIVINANDCLVTGNTSVGYHVDSPISFTDGRASVAVGNLPKHSWTLDNSDTTPSVRGAGILTSNATGATDRYGLDDIVDKQNYTLILNNNDTIYHNNNTDSPDGIFILNSGVNFSVGANGAILHTIIDGSGIYEISRTEF